VEKILDDSLSKIKSGFLYKHIHFYINIFKNFFISFIFFIKSVVFKKKNKTRYRAQHDVK